MQAPHCASGVRKGPVYHRRQPEHGTLYEVVRDNLQTLYAAIEDGFASALPAFVRDEFERYLYCGLLCRGFARLECEQCHEQRLVAFSCKGRGFCPSCLGRRMAQSAANLVDHVLPAVPLRRRRGVVGEPQFVVTYPFELRARLAYDGKLLSSLTRIAIDSILGFYKRRIRDDKNIKGQSGAVSVVQRVSSDLRLNPHLHAIVVDGAFSAHNDSVVFHPLKSLNDSDVADLQQVIRARVVNFLVRRGIVVFQPLLGHRDELTLLDNADDADPSLTQLATAAVSGSLAAGPEIHQRPPVSLRGQPEIAVISPLCASGLGFTLHAATTVNAHDARAREALARYIMRPPLAQERLHLLPNHLVRIELKRAFRDGDAEEW